MAQHTPQSAKTEMAKSTSPSRTSQDAASKLDPQWRFRWPNTADFNFNYYRLLDLAKDSAIAQNRDPNVRIAVIGAGVAGLVAARELFRCGYTNLDIYEASPRIGGRTYSVRLDGQHTTMEMGAMRMPFFDRVDNQNCVLDFYRKLFSIKTQTFPNPGAETADTGVWVNGGYGPDMKKPLDQPTLLMWRKEEKKPPTSTLKIVFGKWDRFAKLFTQVASREYDRGPQDWENFWHAFVQRYWTMSFRDFVHRDQIKSYDQRNPGDFGGLGMDQEEADLFYVIGAGDGGWGAFYDISCLFPVRTLLFGYGSGHQLIQGKFGEAGNYAPGPQPAICPTDSLGHTLQRPEYLGMQSFADCLLYEAVKSSHVGAISLYEAIQSTNYNVNLYTATVSERSLALMTEKSDSIPSPGPRTTTR